MQCLGARWIFRYVQSQRAFTTHVIVAFLVLSGCNSGNKPTSFSSSADDEMCRIDAASHADEGLGKAALSCNGSNVSSLPILYAHFLERTVREEICTDDAFVAATGAIDCAPGPIVLDHGNSVDTGERDWVLPTLPDYFAWHLGGRSSVDEMLYIANANGLPLKSQFIKLENDRDSTLVLFPKTALNPGTRYYLYLVRTGADSEQQRWIQPIMVSTSAGRAENGE